MSELCMGQATATDTGRAMLVNASILDVLRKLETRGATVISTGTRVPHRQAQRHLRGFTQRQFAGIPIVALEPHTRQAFVSNIVRHLRPSVQSNQRVRPRIVTCKLSMRLAIVPNIGAVRPESLLAKLLVAMRRLSTRLVSVPNIGTVLPQSQRARFLIVMLRLSMSLAFAPNIDVGQAQGQSVRPLIAM